MENDTAEDMPATPNETADEKTITELAKSYTMYKISKITTGIGIIILN